jgi:hypothetical protein
MTMAQGSSIPTVSLPDGKDSDLLTIAEAAAIVRMPLNSMRWHRQNDTGPRFFKIGRHVVTTIGDLREWIEEQKRRSLHGGR